MRRLAYTLTQTANLETEGNGLGFEFRFAVKGFQRPQTPFMHKSFMASNLILRSFTTVRRTANLL
jgi:hypothetical protein